MPAPWEADPVWANLISSLTAKASNMGANAIINWTLRGGGAIIKGEGEAVIFEKYPEL